MLVVLPISMAAGRASSAYLSHSRIDSLLYWACRPDAPAQRVYEAVQAAQRAAAVSILHAFVGADVDVLVCKGSELAPRLTGIAR